MEIDLAFLADAATIDASGKLSVLGFLIASACRSFPHSTGGLPSFCGSPLGHRRSVLMRCTSECRIPAGRSFCL